MISIVHYQHVLLPGAGSCDPQGQFIGFGAGVDKKTGVQFPGQSVTQPFCIFGQAVIQVTGIGIKLCHLLLPCFHNLGVAVAHMADIVIQIQKRPAIVIK